MLSLGSIVIMAVINIWNATDIKVQVIDYLSMP